MVSITALLDQLGASGSILVLVSAAMLALHARHALSAGQKVGSWIRTGVVVVLVLALAKSGLIPGLSLHVDIPTLASVFDEPLHQVWRVMRR